MNQNATPVSQSIFSIFFRGTSAKLFYETFVIAFLFLFLVHFYYFLRNNSIYNMKKVNNFASSVGSSINSPLPTSLAGKVLDSFPLLNHVETHFSWRVKVNVKRQLKF